MKKLALGLIAAALFSAPVVSTPVLADEVVSLVGTWSGNGEGVSLTEGWRAGPAKIVVSEQKGRAFKGQVVYEKADGSEGASDLLGAIAPDGKSVVMAQDDGQLTATLQSSDILDICYLETGADAMAVCTRLDRQK